MRSASYAPLSDGNPAATAPPAELMYQQLQHPNQAYGVYYPPVPPMTAVAVPPPPSTAPVAIAQPEPMPTQFELGYGRRLGNWAGEFVSQENARRAGALRAGVDKLATDWVFPMASVVITLWGVHKYNDQTTLEAKDKAIEHMMVGVLALASVFVAHKLWGSNKSVKRANFLKEHALHSPELVDSTSAPVRTHDSRRILHGRVSTVLSAASLGVLIFAAYRFAVADSNHAKDNLGILGGAMLLEVASSVFELWSEQRRCKSINPSLDNSISVKGFNLFLSMASMSTFAIAGALGSFNSGEHYSYNKTLACALILTAGAVMTASILKRTGHEMTERAVATKFEQVHHAGATQPDPRVNTGRLNLGLCHVSMKESTRIRWEELAMKGFVAASAYLIKRMHGVSALGAVAGSMVVVSVAGMLIGKSREVRAVNQHRRVQAARAGVEPNGDLDDASFICSFRCC